MPLKATTIVAKLKFYVFGGISLIIWCSNIGTIATFDAA
jgi:hypothetical protein